MSFWAKTKQAAADAAAATKKGAEKAKLKGVNKQKKWNIHEAQDKMGLAIWDMLDNGDFESAQTATKIQWKMNQHQHQQQQHQHQHQQQHQKQRLHLQKNHLHRLTLLHLQKNLL